MSERKIYVAMDIAKYVMAVMILLGHTANEWAHLTGFWHYALSFDFTVPTFFAISGFLFFSKIEALQTVGEKHQYWKKWSLRVGKMYLVWSLIYIPFILAQWCLHGVSTEKVLSSLHHMLVFSTYPTIWFLPALWVGGSIAYGLYLWCSKTFSILILALLWAVGVVFGAYPDVLEPGSVLLKFHDTYMTLFYTFRNGVFYGSVYVYIGLMVLRTMDRKTLYAGLLGTVLFQLLFVAEAFRMKQVSPNSNTDMAAFMLPSVYFIVLVLTKLNWPPRPLYANLRNQSMLVFCGQRLFLTAIPGLIPAVYLDSFKTLPPVVLMLFFTCVVLLFAYATDKLSVRFPVLTNLR